MKDGINIDKKRDYHVILGLLALNKIQVYGTHLHAPKDRTQ